MLAKLESAARRTFPLVVLLSVAGAGMLIFGAPQRAWTWFVATYFILAAPTLAVTLAAPFTGWRGSKGGRDIPGESR